MRYEYCEQLVENGRYEVECRIEIPVQTCGRLKTAVSAVVVMMMRIIDREFEFYEFKKCLKFSNLNEF